MYTGTLMDSEFDWFRSLVTGQGCAAIDLSIAVIADISREWLPYLVVQMLTGIFFRACEMLIQVNVLVSG